MIYRKFEFPTDLDWQPLIPEGAVVYDLGHIVIKQEEDDSPVLSTGYCVDLLCEELPAELEQYVVWPSEIGKHIPMGWEDWYKEERAKNV
jgi:hypothetical protein